VRVLASLLLLSTLSAAGPPESRPPAAGVEDALSSVVTYRDVAISPEGGHAAWVERRP